ncbi:hypothetical protein [Craterilacuibacter sp.]|uniref:hypothetical protein n=1 Tax=Craterilacuibacter sp. TaxID=2870909 RepID=UPI003F3ECEF9
MALAKIRRFGGVDRWSGLIIRGLPYAIGLLGLFWLGAVISGWLAPAPQQFKPLSQPAPVADAGRVAALHWFGEPLAAGSQAAAPVLKVIGVYASGSVLSDFAIIDEGQGAQALRVGHQSAGGWTLLSVGPRSIRVGRAGAEQEFALSRAEVLPGMVEPATASASMPPPVVAVTDAPVAESAPVPVEGEPSHLVSPSAIPSPSAPADTSARTDILRRPPPFTQP